MPSLVAPSVIPPLGRSVIVFGVWVGSTLNVPCSTALPSPSADTMYQAPWRTSLSAGDELQPPANNETASSISGESFIGSSKKSRGKAQAGNGPVLPCRQTVHQFSP